MTNRATMISEASQLYAFLERAKVSILIAEEGAARFLAKLIVDKTKPVYHPDDNKHMLTQGNWPNWAEVACVISSTERFFGGVSVERKFFETEELMSTYLEGLRQASIEGDRYTTHRAEVYKWDLGPEYVGSRVIY